MSEKDRNKVYFGNGHFKVFLGDVDAAFSQSKHTGLCAARLEFSTRCTFTRIRF